MKADDSHIQSIEITSLGVRVSPSFVNDMFSTVFAVYDSSSQKVHDLKQEIRAHIAIPGFRPGKADKASPVQLRKAICDRWDNVPSLVNALLQVWAEQRSELISRCENLLSNITIETTTTDDEQVAKESQQNMLDLVSQGLIASGPISASKEEIEVAIAFVVQRIVDKQNAPTSANEVVYGLSAWQDVLDVVHKIPPTDTRWDSVAEFLKAVQAIADQKLGEQQFESQRNEFNQKFTAQRPLLLQWAAYFEVSSVAEWDTSKVPASDFTKILGMLQQLVEQLNELDEVQKSQPGTRAERKMVELKLQRLEESILAAYEEIAKSLNGATVEIIKSDVHSPEEIHPLDDNEINTQPEETDNSETLIVQEIQTVAVSDAIEIETKPQDAETSVPEPSPLSPEEQNEIATESVDLPLDETEPQPIEAEAPLEPEVNVEIKVQESSSEEEKSAAEFAYEESLVENVPELEIAEQNPFVAEVSSTDKEAQELPASTADQRLLEYLKLHDFSRAYWIGWALEKTGQQVPLQPWLIAVMQGMLWTYSLWPKRSEMLQDGIEELLQSSTDNFNFQDPLQAELAITVKTLICFLYPSIRLDNWWIEETILQDRPALIELYHLTQSIDLNIFDSAMIQAIVNAGEMEQQIQQYSQQTKEWREKAKSRGISFFRARQVWQELLNPQHGDLYKFLEPVISDIRKRADEVAQQLKQWRDRAWLDRLILKIDQNLQQHKTNRPIVGTPRDQIIGWISDVCDIVELWVNSVKRGQISASPDQKWRYEQTEHICQSGQTLVEAALQEAQTSLENSADENNTIGLDLSHLLLKGLYAILTPGKQADLEQFTNPPLPLTIQFQPEAHYLERQLAHALLVYYEIEFDDHGVPNLNAPENLLEVLTQSSDRSVNEAIECWIKLNDYRFIPTLLNVCPERQIWEERSREAFQSDAQYLEQKEIQSTIVAIEQALLDGLISDSEHTGFHSRVESLRKNLQQSGRESMQAISLKRIFTGMQAIQAELNKRREDRLVSLRSHWDEIKQQLVKLTHDNDELSNQIIRMVEAGLATQDLRTTGEYLAHLDAVASGTQDLNKSVFEAQKTDEKDILGEFHQEINPLISALSHFSLDKIMSVISSSSHQIQDFHLPADLPKPRRTEAHRGLEAWNSLKKNGMLNEKEALINVQTVMEYLGFTFSHPNPITPKHLTDSAYNFSHWRGVASAGEFSPVAQFGSQRRGVYDVIGVWERPGFDIISSQISSLMKKTGNQPTILFYFGRLGTMQRKKLWSIARKDRLPMLVVDEILILHLTRQFGTRLRPMFLATIPYATINPYFPAGLVPPEVFKGRGDMVQRLIDPNGPAIVYGGRQLGKSALLHKVEGEFHHPENNQFAIYLDIRSIGDPLSGRKNQYQLDLVDQLVQSIKSKMPDTQRIPTDIDRMMNFLQTLLVEKNLRLILLLDEADHFLDADAEKNFIVLQKLKNLMNQSERRFKLVIAGLHNVQRFQRISNQPLAHLGTPIEIGPLAPDAARDLLVDPLHALGYRFGNNPQDEDISLVLHILSYTNYHPGLIQLFGSYLVEHLWSRTQGVSLPPISITRQDVETVYRKKEVREAIRDRFNLTLALDPRYEAIVLALILEQWEDQNGFDRRYTPRELREIVAEWWSAAFGDDITPDRFKGFLDEMRGLGVLATVDNGSRYRLRSPNLVHLMGTFEEIYDRMDTLSRSTPPGEHALESCHPILVGGKNNYFSPFTFAQEQLLNSQQSGVALIFGSNALRLTDVTVGVQRLLPEGDGKAEEIHIAAQSGLAIKQQLDDLTQKNPGARYLIALRELDGNPNELLDQVSTAMRYCRQLRGKATLRVLFMLNPQTAWQWFNIPTKERELIEEQVHAVMLLQKWDRTGIKLRIEMKSWGGQEMMGSDRSINKIIEATNGWPLLLDDLFSRVSLEETSSLIDLSRLIDEFRTELTEPGSLRESMIRSLEIYEDLPKQVITMLLKDEVVTLISEDQQPPVDVLAQGISNVTEEELRNTLEYLARMSIIGSEQRAIVDPVVARLWRNV